MGGGLGDGLGGTVFCWPPGILSFGLRPWRGGTPRVCKQAAESAFYLGGLTVTTGAAPGVAVGVAVAVAAGAGAGDES